LVDPNSDFASGYGGIGVWIKPDGTALLWNSGCAGSTAAIGSGAGLCVGFRNGLPVDGAVYEQVISNDVASSSSTIYDFDLTDLKGAVTGIHTCLGLGTPSSPLT